MMTPEIRAVDRHGSVTEILPDWASISYLDDYADIGTVQIDYAIGGVREELLAKQREYALLLDGREVENGRFVLDEDEANEATDVAEVRTWSGRTLLARFEEAIVVSAGDKGHNLARYTPESALVYANELGEDMDPLLVAERAARGRANNQRQPDPREEVILDTYPDPEKDVGWQRNSTVEPEPRTFKGSAGKIMRTLIAEAVKRGALAWLDDVAFSDTHDSNGVKWPDTAIERTPDIGSTLLDLLLDLRDSGYAVPRMHGRTLRLYAATSGDPDSATAEFAIGKNLLDGPSKGSTADLLTRVYAVSDGSGEDEGAKPHGWTQVPSMEAAWGVLEGHQSQSGVVLWETLEANAERAIIESAREAFQNTFGIIPRAEHGTVPYRDFVPGDWVWIDKTGIPEQQRVRAITLTWNENREMEVGVTCNDILYDRGLLRYKKTVREQKGAADLDARRFAAQYQMKLVNAALERRRQRTELLKKKQAEAKKKALALKKKRRKKGESSGYQRL